MAKPAVIEARKAKAMEAHAEGLAGVTTELAELKRRMGALVQAVTELALQLESKKAEAEEPEMTEKKPAKRQS